MNETTEQSSDKSGPSAEDANLPNTASDSNANRSDITSLKQTGAIPKSKCYLQNTTSEVSKLKIRANNNLLDIPIKNIASNLYKEGYVQGNDDDIFDKSFPKHNFEMMASNGLKFPSVKGFSSKKSSIFSPENEYCFTNGVAQYKKETGRHGSYSSPSEPGPSSRSIDKVSSVLPRHSTQDLDSDDCSSDIGNDDLCCDDCCVYTYKGDMADLPRSFMNLDHQDNIDDQDGSRAGSRGSSPDMDFLEMDFDPEPSYEAESDESSVKGKLKDCGATTSQSDDTSSSEEPKPSCSTDHQKTITTRRYVSLDEPQPCCSKSDPQEQIFRSDIDDCPNAIRETVQNNLSLQISTSQFCKPPEQKTYCPVVTISNDTLVTENSIDFPWIPKNASQRTVTCEITQDTKALHSSNGDLIACPTENIVSPTSAPETRINSSSSLHNSTTEKTKQDVESSVDKTMIWSIQEAVSKQTTQISASACGATAVINVLQALRFEIPPNEKILEAVTTRLRANSSTLLTYLDSRSVAGSTHKDLILGLHKLTNGKVYARFFPMFPERYMNLSSWLSYWIKKGAIPIATLNLQKGVSYGSPIPDAWHHQMIFGVGPHGIYLTNPLERVEERLLWHQLTSESVLQVRREDVISRFDFKKSLKELMAIKDVRWRKLNVVGQTANVVREHRLKYSTLSRTHVCIPASYEAGITLAVNTSNPALELLKTCPELPILGTLP